MIRRLASIPDRIADTILAALTTHIPQAEPWPVVVAAVAIHDEPELSWEELRRMRVNDVMPAIAWLTALRDDRALAAEAWELYMREVS